MEMLMVSSGEPLTYSLKMDSEVSGFLAPEEKHHYVEVLPMGRYEIEVQDGAGAQILVLDQFDETLGEIRDADDTSGCFFVPGRELVFVQVKNSSGADVHYSFKLKRNPRQLMILQAYSA